MYAVTNRIRHAPSSDDPTPSFSDARATILSATRFSISVPPAHKTGNIEWPGRDPDPLVAMTVAARQDMPLSALIDDIASGPRRADVRIFVHGYNTSLQEGLFRLAQVTYDSGGEGAAILFSWPSTATMVGYAADREAVTYSRDHLTELLTMLARDKRIGQITVLGHSMGGWLVMETLRQLRLIGDDPVLCQTSIPPFASMAAMSEIARSRTNGSSLEGMKPCRCQNRAASSSTALTIKARPPIRREA